MDLDEGQNNTGEITTHSRITTNGETGETEHEPSFPETQLSEKSKTENDVRNFDVLAKSFVLKCDRNKTRSKESSHKSQNLNEYQQKFLRHRTNEELFASDEDSDGSNRSENSDKSWHIAEVSKQKSPCNNRSFMEHLNSIPGFYDCNDKVSSLLALNERVRYRNNEIDVQGTYEEITSKLSKSILNSKSSDSSSEPLVLEISPEKSNVSDCGSSHENNRHPSISQKRNPFSSPCLNRHTEKVSEMFSEHHPISTYPKFRRHVFKTESIWKSFTPSEIGTYKMISTPIMFNSNSIQSSQDHTFPIIEKNSFASNSSSNLFDKFPKKTLSPTAEECDLPNFKIHQPNFSHSLELPSTSKHVYCAKEDLNSSNELGSSNTKNLKKFSHSWESPNTSNRHASPRFLPNSCSKRKLNRKLNCDDSNTSSDEARENYPRKKETQKRRKTFPFHVSNSSDSHSTIETQSKTGSVENVSKDANSSASSTTKSDKKLSNDKGNMSPNNILRSLDIINSENLEAYQSSRKRLISNGRSSDIEKSDLESKQMKKMKQCTYSE